MREQTGCGGLDILSKNHLVSPCHTLLWGLIFSLMWQGKDFAGRASSFALWASGSAHGGTHYRHAHALDWGQADLAPRLSPAVPKYIWLREQSFKLSGTNVLFYKVRELRTMTSKVAFSLGHLLSYDWHVAVKEKDDLISTLPGTGPVYTWHARVIINGSSLYPQTCPGVNYRHK